MIKTVEETLEQAAKSNVEFKHLLNRVYDVPHTHHPDTALKKAIASALIIPLLKGRKSSIPYVGASLAAEFSFEFWVTPMRGESSTLNVSAFGLRSFYLLLPKGMSTEGEEPTVVNIFTIDNLFNIVITTHGSILQKVVKATPEGTVTTDDEFLRKVFHATSLVLDGKGSDPVFRKTTRKGKDLWVPGVLDK